MRFVLWLRYRNRVMCVRLPHSGNRSSEGIHAVYDQWLRTLCTLLLQYSLAQCGPFCNIFGMFTVVDNTECVPDVCQQRRMMGCPF